MNVETYTCCGCLHPVPVTDQPRHMDSGQCEQWQRTGMCRNPWHRSAPARMEQDCPECRTPPEAVTVELAATFTMTVSIADWIMAYGVEAGMVPADARTWLENVLHSLDTTSDVQGQIIARIVK